MYKQSYNSGSYYNNQGYTGVLRVYRSLSFYTLTLTPLYPFSIPPRVTLTPAMHYLALNKITPAATQRWIVLLA